MVVVLGVEGSADVSDELVDVTEHQVLLVLFEFLQDRLLTLTIPAQDKRNRKQQNLIIQLQILPMLQGLNDQLRYLCLIQELLPGLDLLLTILPVISLPLIHHLLILHLAGVLFLDEPSKNPEDELLEVTGEGLRVLGVDLHDGDDVLPEREELETVLVHGVLVQFVEVEASGLELLGEEETEVRFFEEVLDFLDLPVVELVDVPIVILFARVDKAEEFLHQGLFVVLVHYDLLLDLVHLGQGEGQGEVCSEPWLVVQIILVDLPEPQEFDKFPTPLLQLLHPLLLQSVALYHRLNIEILRDRILVICTRRAVGPSPFVLIEDIGIRGRELIQVLGLDLEGECADEIVHEPVLVVLVLQVPQPLEDPDDVVVEVVVPLLVVLAEDLIHGLLEILVVNDLGETHQDLL